MSRGLGVTYYDTPEGGSGFVTNASLPWLSTFEPYQLNPVYDQETQWLRDSKPGSFSNYPRFGDPYSLDGGTQPPFAAAGFDGPVPVETSCGIGDLTLLRSDVVAPMPSITDSARYPCVQQNSCPSDIATWVQTNPWLAAGLALAAGFILFGGGRK
jgi:hypothetical protein